MWDGPRPVPHVGVSEPAIMLEGGSVISGCSHNEIMLGLWGTPHQYEKRRYGFLTSEGKFVNRFTAATIARAAGQVSEGVACPDEGLHSSDVAWWKLRADELMEPDKEPKFY